MLSKTYFLATILLLALILSAKPAQAQAWQTTTVQALINPKTLLTTERWRLTPWGVEIPIESAIDHTSECYQAAFDNFLKTQILDKPLKVQWVRNYKATQLYRTGKIKFGNRYDLAEFLLAQGWAQLSPEIENLPESYRAAEDRAQKDRLGLWGACDKWYEIRQDLKRKGQNPWQTIPGKSMLESSGIGWIKTILAPHLIELDSGQKISLQGLKTPNIKSDLYKCWGKSLVPVLQSRWQGQKVLLEKDHLQIDLKARALQRYVWIPANRWQSKELLNASAVAEGIALLDSSSLNLKNVEAMHQAQAQFQAKTVPPAWWVSCAQDLVRFNSAKQETNENLEYDENCRIKGNIAGSKKNPKRTYHTPASGWYKRIEYEQCFDSEAEAESAGFNKVK